MPVVGGLRQGVLQPGLIRSGLSCGIPAAWAMVSAVLNPMTISHASRYGSFFTIVMDAAAYFL